MGTHADSRVASCRRRFHAAPGSGSATGASVPMLEQPVGHPTGWLHAWQSLLIVIVTHQGEGKPSVDSPFHQQLPGTSFTYVAISHSVARARAGRRSPTGCSPASLNTGPVESTAQTDYSILQADILAVHSCPRGFDLVAGVTNKSTTSPSHLRPPSLVWKNRRLKDGTERSATSAQPMTKLHHPYQEGFPGFTSVPGRPKPSSTRC
jgi:hypothetical protein